ncbi:MAG: Nucleoside triphosphate pyrophosphohydrolase MazG [uncultured Acidimicrobiales bacterium]|uniref:Nucleoside triphosphate pyrophosphohydrolase MazG n=1 Tax=uncultured Acidimicrobiales bacterium TaxID=310071 RepID=A0A6J4IBU7_9ACTN|nr:MAG: Nucleoside triphosphate pyrophosphohydrolase MazG [uncultured Acidimicrobiales bacterium]
MRVTVVGLGPGGPDLVTAGTVAAIEATPVRFLRTSRHPSASVVVGATSFDDLYDRSETFADVYRAIADRLAEAAAVSGHVLYAVPGNPRVLERSVELLLADERLEVEVLPALSFLDLAWVRLGVDPLDAGVRLVDGHRFVVEAAGERGPLLVGHCHNRRVLSDIKLAVDGDGTDRVLVLQRLGLPDEAVTEVAWADLDRSVEPDHLTSLYIPHLAAPVAGEVVRFTELVRTLRERCPWDREQTHQSLTRHLLEESYEVLDAIAGLGGAPGTDDDDGAGYEHLEEELGDLLFQVVFHATLATEAGQFTLADVARTVHDKLVVRHPHVFGDADAADAAAVMATWEERKRAEKGRDSVFDGIPAALPALSLAYKVQRKASSLGVEAEGGGPLDLAALSGADEVGTALYAVVAAARRLDVDPEAALRAAAARATAAARAVEAAGGAAT